LARTLHEGVNRNVHEEARLSGSMVVLGVALLYWALLFVYILRVERRLKELERE